ncbi:type IV pilus twitching motility protein PilT [bacterium]|nr:type IV pilus twitching motility protein PilT [bacterium]MBU3956234.1 type IV pilus twitching motility protein PilT [bacterium]
MDMIDVLTAAVKMGVSDIHVVPTKPVMVRKHGEMMPLPEYKDTVLSGDDTKTLIYGILLDDQKSKFEENFELDCSFQIENVSRFRVNVLMQKDGVGSVMRVISSDIPSPEALAFTPAMMECMKYPRGLVLVTGPTGSGKSTTLAAMLNTINGERKEHILTIEDPIEFVYKSKGCVFTQREVGASTRSFTSALRAALREDPDIVLVGEMRDLETIGAALTIAETGHLVFGTLHTTDAPQTVDRIIDVFPSHQQAQVRTQLSVTLKAVITQQLLQTPDGKGRVAAREILIVTPAIANLIRDGKTHLIYGALETGMKYGMISMDKALAQLVKAGKITKEAALIKAGNPEMLKQYMTSASVGGGMSGGMPGGASGAARRPF